MRNILIILIVLLYFSFANEKMQKKEKGQLYLTAPTITSLTTANTYIPVSGNFTDGNIKNFVLRSDGRIEYIGYGNDILIVGVADIAVDKNCTITFSMFRNGVYVAGADTPHVFSGVAKTETISITRIIYVQHGDTFQAFCKSSEATTDLNVLGLSVTFWGR